MNHPDTAGVDWKLVDMVFDANGPGIAVAVFARNNGTEHALGYRWLTNETYFGRETEWILLPHEFTVDFAHRIAAKKAAGMTGIRDAGFQKLIEMLKNQEDIIPGIGY